jgi:hypothetical protein
MRSKSTYNPSDTTAIKARLLEQLPRLIECLFAGRSVHRTEFEYRIGNNGSVSIRLDNGCYFNHETGEGGDIISFIQHTLKMDFKGAVLFAKNLVGNAPLAPITPPDNLQRKIDENAMLKRDKALEMLKRSIPINNTLAEVYLRKYRAISLEQIPASLRFIEHAYNYTAGGYFPAMIASISDLDGNIIAAHCTFIAPKTGDKLQGNGIKSRLIFGGCRGGAIRLSQATEKLALCEGVEDGLSILQSAPDLTVWATAGTSNLRAVLIPDFVKEVIICADNDKAGSEAATDLAARLVAENKTVRIAKPPAGFKDFNDFLRNGNRHEK